MKLFAVVLLLGLAGSNLVQGADGPDEMSTDLPQERPDLTCSQIRVRDPSMLTCNDDGSFPEYQCLNATLCFCIGQEFGERRSGPYTNDTVASRCERSDDDCKIQMGNETRILLHGSRRLSVDGSNCSTCRCNDGDITCTTTTCPTKTATCSYMEREYRVGASYERGCYTCVCGIGESTVEGEQGPGRWNCPKTSCPGEKECDCENTENEPVCYKGTTYRNRCLLKCRDVVDELIEAGACRSKDPCVGATCTVGQVCHRRQYSCLLSAMRCSFYNCSAACAASPPASEMVCGSDGTSYASRCRLEMARSRTEELLLVRYEGACDDTRCPDGAVCGVDGLTYKSRCDSRFRNVRVDYVGACKKNPREVVCPACRTDNAERVRPFRSVCGICGGVLNIAYNQEELRRYIDTSIANDDSARRDYRESLSGLIRAVNTSTPLMHRLSLLSGCTASYDTAVDQIQVIYESQTRDPKYCRDAATILGIFWRENRLARADELETGSVLLNNIPARDTQIVGSELAAVLQSTSTSFSENSITGSSAAMTGATLATVLLFALIGFLANM